MSSRLTVVFLPLLALVLACEPPPVPEPKDGNTTPDVILPDCAATGTVFGIDLAEQQTALDAGAPLPVTQGFQGFLFVRVGLVSPQPLPPVLKQLQIHATVQGGAEVLIVERGVKTQQKGDGAQSLDVPLFFNDWPLAELVGKSAHIELAANAGTCTARASVDVMLTMGSFMGADAGFWSQTDTSP